MNVFQMSVTASVLIIFVIILRAIAINYLPKKTFIALWGIVLARLIIPISIPLDFKLFSFGDIAIDANAVFMKGANNLIAPIISNDILYQNSLNATNKIMNNLDVLTIFWLSGFAICLILFLGTYIRCYKDMREALPIKGNKMIDEWIIKQNAKRKVTILTSDRITTPITFGFINPKIVFPKNMNWSNVKQVEYILYHEITHIRRFDNIWKFISMIVLCVHWFNPIVWIMYILFNRDLEIACDENVIYKSGESIKSDYALLLINLAQKKVKFTPLYNDFGKNAIMERIECIMKFKKIPVLATVLSLILIIGAVSVFATNGVDNTGSTKTNDFEITYANKIPFNAADKNSSFTLESNTTKLEGEKFYSFEEFKKWVENLQAETDKLVKKGELTKEKADTVVNFYKDEIAKLEKDGGIKVGVVDKKLLKVGELKFELKMDALAEILSDGSDFAIGIMHK